MKKNFDRIVLVLTLLLGGAGCAFCLMIYGRTAQDTWGRIIWSGLFFSLPFAALLPPPVPSPRPGEVSS